MWEIFDKYYFGMFIFTGIYGLLMAYRILPRNPKDPEKLEIWHKKFGKMFKIISPILIVYGILRTIMVFNN